MLVGYLDGAIDRYTRQQSGDRDRQFDYSEQQGDQCDPDWAAAESMIESSSDDSNAEIQEVEPSRPDNPKCIRARPPWAGGRVPTVIVSCEMVDHSTHFFRAPQSKESG